ncbi:MAG TPA: GNAT family N-acetyltransferase [Alphaproteobacteria bacterium]|nr:GNAT family N-acetyltransferase [Alphaproteobacteria bacterium]
MQTGDMSNVTIRAAGPVDDLVLARHFHAMWRDNDVPKTAIVADWEARVASFLAEARARLDYQGFIAESGDGTVVGSAGGQRFAGLYPDVLAPAHRTYGYVWGVYVEAGWRCRGIARRLTEAAIEHLKGMGCTRVLLHSSPHGRTVYEKLGFEPTNEMGRTLR